MTSGESKVLRVIAADGVELVIPMVFFARACEEAGSPVVTIRTIDIMIRLYRASIST